MKLELQKTIILELSTEESMILMELLDSVSGTPDKVGRRFK